MTDAEIADNPAHLLTKIGEMVRTYEARHGAKDFAYPIPTNKHINGILSGYKRLQQHQRTPSKARTINIKYRITPDLNEELSIVAKASGVSKCLLVETILRRYVSKILAILKANPQADFLQILEKLDQ